MLFFCFFFFFLDLKYLDVPFTSAPQEYRTFSQIKDRSSSLEFKNSPR